MSAPSRSPPLGEEHQEEYILGLLFSHWKTSL